MMSLNIHVARANILLRRSRSVAHSSSTRRRVLCPSCARINNTSDDQRPIAASTVNATEDRRYYQTKINVTFTDKSNGEEKEHSQISAAVNPTLAPYIRSFLLPKRSRIDLSVTEESRPDTALNTDFLVSFLGTGSGGVQATDRLSSATLLRLGGQAFLFDAGEGVQRQLQRSRAKPLDITNIFITHLHGDHVYGLSCLLLTIQDGAATSLLGRDRKTVKERPVINVYGPAGTYNLIAMTIALSLSKIRFIKIIVHELVGGKNDRGMQHRRKYNNKSGKRGGGGGGHRNIFLSEYEEFSSPGIERRRIDKNTDGYWVLQTSERAYAESRSNGRERELKVHAGEVEHLPGVQTFGYTVEELTPQRKLDQEKAMDLGVLPGKKYERLKDGIPVMSDDGTKTILPDDVLLDHIKPRKFALIGDNCAVPPEMARLCEGADVFVHEATVSGHKSKAISRGHANAEMAGEVAKNIGAKTLLLNHISSAVGEDGVVAITAEAEKANDGASQVQVACDFMEVMVPKGGFPF